MFVLGVWRSGLIFVHVTDWSPPWVWISSVTSVVLIKNDLKKWSPILFCASFHACQNKQENKPIDLSEHQLLRNRALFEWFPPYCFSLQLARILLAKSFWKVLGPRVLYCSLVERCCFSAPTRYFCFLILLGVKPWKWTHAFSGFFHNF